MYPSRAHVLKTLANLHKLLPSSEQSKPQILLLAGASTAYRNDTDAEQVFRQESNFYYLTGCDVPGSYLLVAYQNGTSFESTPSVYLFIPAIDEDHLLWSVPPPTLEAAGEMYKGQYTKIEAATELQSTLTTLVKAFPEAVFHTLPPTTGLFPVIPGETLTKSGIHAIHDLYLLSALQLTRLIKDDHEISLIEKAYDMSSRAHETVMRTLGKAVKHGLKASSSPGVQTPSEWLIESEADAEAIFVASCRREGSIHQAYLPICASFTRASTLHYCCNDKAFAWSPGATSSPSALKPQVLLLDAGGELNNYASDITRTLPLGNSGRFSQEAAQIYDLVHLMQSSVFSALKPGVHWDSLHVLSHRVLITGLVKLGILKSSFTEAELLKSGISTRFYPHGLGHSLGLDTHDVPTSSKPIVNPTLSPEFIDFNREDVPDGGRMFRYLRLRLPLKVGMVVTVEPGCYFHPHQLPTPNDEEAKYVDFAVLEKYRDVGGVRIEDGVVITESGFTNLTKVKSSRDWVEKVCSGEL